MSVNIVEICNLLDRLDLLAGEGAGEGAGRRRAADSVEGAAQKVTMLESREMVRKVHEQINFFVNICLINFNKCLNVSLKQFLDEI